MKKYISITEDRFLLTESAIRRNELEQHLAVFFKNGGTITKIADGVSAETITTVCKPFVIGSHRVKQK
jgi:hypothetical protein